MSYDLEIKDAVWWNKVGLDLKDLDEPATVVTVQESTSEELID